MKSTSRNISIPQAESLTLELFNISGKATSLPGYIDFNFKVIAVDGGRYILKVSRPEEDWEYLDFQQQLLQHVAEFGKGLIVPRIVIDSEERSVSTFVDAEGNQRMLRLLTWIPGRLWGDVNPQLDDLRYSLGERCGLLTKALQAFNHSQAHRELEWDVARSLWTTAHLNLFNKEEKRIVIFFQNRFKDARKSYELLRKAIVHNDANDNNLIVSEDLIKPKVKAVIDYGDAVYTQVINDVAIACAYAIMGHNDPLQTALPIVKGYSSKFPLEERELKHLYDAIAMRLVVSVTKSAINKSEEPENTYLLISEKPAWEVLEKWSGINADFAYYNFRQACGFTPQPFEQKFKNWATNHNFLVTDLFPTIRCDEVHLLDLSVSSRWLGMQSDFDDTELFQFKIDRLQREYPNKVIAGGYLEPRGVYTTSEYGRIGNSGPEYRTVHLGVDFWLSAGTGVHALLDGEVVTAVNDAGDKEYGGLIILKHTTETLSFYTLYGHLSVASIQDKVIGQVIGQGEHIGFLGLPEENGNWAPHLHFQIMLSMLGYTKDFPGVGYITQINVWKGICPDPNLLFKSTSLQTQFPKPNDELINFRKRHLGKSLSLQYQVPIKMVRGAGQYLIDQYGRKYLDTVNNVAHVGHEHPEVVRAGQQQMALINTNSRYLHDNINELTKELLATLPPQLSVLHFVNSGSEANELALRMAKAATGHEEIIASQFGYHG
ncbi:MAG TPA: aminotransferase class III-fold pyridoxal phosphate-dependent enzyme, partial [Pricia antarctica]|nr:aminotransferase class III-fold pyridoxal phosphate-dependent enzyme [Pricia antarctica]